MMRFKKSIIIALFLLCILMIGAVSAASDNNDTIVSSDVKHDYISHSDDNINDKTDTTSLNEKKETKKVISTDEINDREKSKEKLSYTPNDVFTDTEASFTDLNNEIKSNTGLDLSHDYKFNNGTDTDYKDGIVIKQDNFVLNGNGRTIDGNNQSRIFNITGNNVILKNLILTGGNANKGGTIYSTGILILNNITFINNYAKTEGGAIGLYGDVTLSCDNSRFIDNYAEAGSGIYVEKGKLNLYNTNMTSKVFNKYSQIAALRNSTINIENATFANSTSSYSPALYLRDTKTSIINSKFINLKGNITSGAIGIRFGGEIYIKNCEFINTTSSKNAGAIYADIFGEGEGGNMTILNTLFKDTYSDFGGALLQLGGDLLINNSEFINGHATYNGGSIYLSYVNSIINNCTFDSNSVDIIEGYPTYGGAIFNDMGTLNVDKSKFTNNNASAGSAIYAYDSSYNIRNSVFENNTNPIYSVFDEEINIDESNIFVNDDDISTNNTYYATIMTGEGIQLTLLNNTIDVSVLPAKFDLRDWGWVSPVRAQGWMGSCWTFGMTGTLESALLKVAGIKTDFSENNMQNSMLRYSIYGSAELVEGGFNAVATGYLLSWLGAFTQNADVYDEMGKISPLITTTQDIHVQDVMFTPNNEIPNGTQLKLAILKYGSMDISYYGQSRYDEVILYYNNETYAQYVDVDTPKTANHEVSVVGWDDNFPKEKFLTPPPGDGAWIVKNSWGTDWGDNGYLYVSYYDVSFLQYMEGAIPTYATSIIFENTLPYNKNYQYDMTWLADFLNSNGNAGYMNVYEALDDDLIAAVGTYFNESGVNYKVEIYVNDELKLTQEGVSPFVGYHTIKLNEYIPIKVGDVFKAKIISNTIPYILTDNMRVHYTENLSFFSIDGSPWADSYKDVRAIVCIKVYTVADDSKIINNNDITVDYGSDSYFSVQVVTADGHTVGAGAIVNFNINGKTTTTTTDSNGIAKIKITENPGNYIITTTYKNQTYKNNLNIINTTNNPTDKTTNNTPTTTTTKTTTKKTTTKITAKKTTYKSKTKTKKYTITLKTNKKAINKATITLTIKGKKYKKTYKVKTNSKGKATFKIKKLNKKGKYTATITYKGTKKYKATKKTVKITIK